MNDRARLSLPPESDWTSAQRDASALIRSGPRGDLFGPFVPLLNAPELMTQVQKVGEYLRYSSAISNDVFEFAILTVAHHWKQEFEWCYHGPLAVEAGVPLAVVRDVAEGRRPTSGRADFGPVWDFVRALLTSGATDDATFAGVAALGEQVVVELITTVGYYTTLAFTLNVARTPAPDVGSDLPRWKS